MTESDSRVAAVVATMNLPAFVRDASNIGRDGELIFDDGRHRFIVARILELESIPARVLVRHQQWQDLRKTLHDSSSIHEISPEAERYLRHSDMKDVVPHVFNHRL